jgi:RNA polymerase sigma factor (sigma-70 family)
MPVDVDVPEAQLVLKAQNGDVDSFEQLVERYSDLAFRTAYVVLGTAADAEDACQDAFIKAHRALPTFHAELPLRPWLLRIVANEARNRRRGRSRRPEITLDPGAGDAAAGPGPEQSAVLADELARLLDVVNRLPDDDRQVVVCRYFLELSVDETAGVLGWPGGTVKSRLHRAVERLRHEMGHREE